MNQLYWLEILNHWHGIFLVWQHHFQQGDKGFNGKLIGVVLGTKPNPYQAVLKFNELITEEADDTIAVAMGNFS